MKILVREAKQSDWAFVFATYIRNRWFDKANRTTLKRATWSAMQHKRLEAILSHSSVLIACLSEDPDTILGYAFMDSDGPYAYIKLDFRSEGLGVANKLLGAI